MEVVIISGGKAPTAKLLEKYINKDSYVICADSGANSMYKYGYVPNLILGDFDSIDDGVLSYFKNKDCIINIFPAEKDFTDTEAALEETIKLSPSKIVFLGCIGTRLDHVIANLGMLKRCLELNISACIVDENNIITLHDKNFIMEGRLGETFSLHSFGSEVKNLSIKGAKYRLDNYNLCFGDPRTVSNEFLNNEVNITFKSGIIMLFKVND